MSVARGLMTIVHGNKLQVAPGPSAKSGVAALCCALLRLACTISSGLLSLPAMTTIMSSIWTTLGVVAYRPGQFLAS